MDLNDKTPGGKCALFKNSAAVKRSPRAKHSPYPIIYQDTDQRDDVVIKVAHARDVIIEFGPWSGPDKWEVAFREFRPIADRVWQERHQ